MLLTICNVLTGERGLTWAFSSFCVEFLFYLINGVYATDFYLYTQGSLEFSLWLLSDVAILFQRHFSSLTSDTSYFACHEFSQFESRPNS